MIGTTSVTQKYIAACGLTAAIPVEMKVDQEEPEQPAVVALYAQLHPVVPHPEQPDDEEADGVGHIPGVERGQGMAEVLRGEIIGQADIEHEQRDGDGNDRVAEEDQALETSLPQAPRSPFLRN